MGATHRLLRTVATAALLFTVASWVLTIVFFMPHLSPRSEKIAAPTVVIVPDGLATWWLFRKLQVDRSRSDARRAVTAFAVSAPVVLAIGYLLGELVGGYTEVILGGYFVLPAVVAFIILLIVFIPYAVVSWALHPSGGMEPVSESGRE
jgi:hypothetical protein